MSLTRREVLKDLILVAATGGIPVLAACAQTRQEAPASRATQTPAITPAVAPTILPNAEAVDEKILAEIRREVFRLDRYPQSLRQGMVNFWLQGVTQL